MNVLKERKQYLSQSVLYIRIETIQFLVDIAILQLEQSLVANLYFKLLKCSFYERNVRSRSFRIVVGQCRKLHTTIVESCI